jgi:hypothetical protein
MSSAETQQRTLLRLPYYVLYVLAFSLSARMLKGILLLHQADGAYSYQCLGQPQPLSRKSFLFPKPSVSADAWPRLLVRYCKLDSSRLRADRTRAVSALWFARLGKSLGDTRTRNSASFLMARTTRNAPRNTKHSTD